MAIRSTAKQPNRMHRHCSRGHLLSGVALGVVLTGAAQAQTAPAANPEPGPVSSHSLETVTVTAQRRSQNLQDVPISVQALTGTQLKRLNVENFDDLVKQLPNVTVGGYGPGQANVYMRGLSVGGDLGGQGGGGVGAFPNVAVYLDDQSAQVPGKNLDLYPVDLQRIEVLEGPQGTLFGSGAQGGVFRYITNKPDLSHYSGTVDAGFAGTEHGAMSGNADLTVNIPIVKDKAAFRVTMYDDERGGYIDNVPGTFVREPTDLGIHYAGYTKNAQGVPQLNAPSAQNTINNYKIASKNINPTTYQGIRGEFAVKFSEDWNALITESAQKLDAEGVFYEMPFTSGSKAVKLPDLSVQLFEPSYAKDFFENTAWTLNGRIGFLNLVYDGAYLIRNSVQQQDYTNYARGLYADYYQCQPKNVAKGITKSQCYSPGSTWNDYEHDSHLSQEIRASTPDNWRLRGTGGFFYEDFKIQDEVNFNYKTAPGFTDIGPPPGSTANNPDVRANDTGFFNDITRGYTQYALFGSADFDIIPHVLTITGGTRWYAFDNYEKGSAVSSFGCSVGYSGGAPCLADATNVDAKHLRTTDYGFKSRANITWKITPDIMVYYTFSQGYRPGGYNRRPPTTKVTVNGVTETVMGDIGYTSDKLTNNEIGYKMQFFQHTLTVNGAFYQEEWDNVQDRLFDPGAFGNLAFVENGPNYRVRGLEVAVTDRPMEGLTLSGSTSLNDTKQLTSPPFYATNGIALPGSQGIFGEIGSTLALSPAWKMDAHARYEYPFGDYTTFIQVGIEHQSHTHSAVADFNNFYMSPITTVDMSAGLSYKDWRATAYVENLTNERGQEFISAAQFVQAVVVERPLTAGLKLSYDFH